MSMDEFEKSLQLRPLRQIPQDWRESILRTASRNASGSTSQTPRAWNLGLFVLWRELIQPCRYAWSGMAALWLIFWMINTHSQSGDAPAQKSASVASASEQVQKFKEQRGMLVELTGPVDWPGPAPTRGTSPKPHTELAIPTRHC